MNISLKEVRKIIKEQIRERNNHYLLYYPDETASIIDRMLFESGVVLVEDEKEAKN